MRINSRESAEQKTYMHLVQLAKTLPEPEFIEVVSVAWEIEMITREQVVRLSEIFLRYNRDHER